MRSESLTFSCCTRPQHIHTSFILQGIHDAVRHSFYIGENKSNQNTNPTTAIWGRAPETRQVSSAEVGKGCLTGRSRELKRAREHQSEHSDTPSVSFPQSGADLFSIFIYYSLYGFRSQGDILMSN